MTQRETHEGKGSKFSLLKAKVQNQNQETEFLKIDCQGQEEASVNPSFKPNS